MSEKVTRQCPQTTTFEEKGEPKRIRTEVPLFTSLTPYRLTARPNRLTLTEPELGAKLTAGSSAPSMPQSAAIDAATHHYVGLTLEPDSLGPKQSNS